MTDFEKIKSYYSVFDEQNRLEKADGRLEFEMSLSLLLKYLEKGSTILDLGGGAGKYSIELARRGFRVTLADLSERLLAQAKATIEENHLPQLQGMDVVNAVDLSCYRDRSFDSVILFGPLYHLLENSERQQCVAEVHRVLKPGGMVFASFIPYLTGAVGAMSRALYFPDQVNTENLTEVFKTGKFNNNASYGFQEGYYPKSEEITELFEEQGFSKMILRSVRGFGYNKEEKLYEQADSALFRRMLELINETAADPALVETCGHAVYIGRKNQAAAVE